MKKNGLIIAIVIVVLLVLAWVLINGGDGPVADQNVTLKASSDQESYNSGDEVSINIALTNSGEADICLSEGSIGNIKFTSYTRDGETLDTRSAPSYFITSFSEILKSRLMSVAPGDNLELSLTSTLDPGLGVEALSTTMPDDTSGNATFYNVEDPGSYVIDLVYEYVAGPSDNCQNIFNGATNTATVTFTVE